VIANRAWTDYFARSRMKPSIYLDNNATTCLAPEVFDAMVPWLRDGYGNPSSAYSLGRLAAQALETARDQVSALLGCRESEVLFTSCGTESINTAIQAALERDPDKKHIVTTTVEHSATIKVCEHLAQRGYEITWLRVDEAGHLDLEQLEHAIRSDTALISCLWANNETGVLFPIDRIAAIAAKKKCLLHVDAVQAVGKLPLELESSGIHFLSAAGHKIHAAKGVGALYINRRAKFSPLFRGSQESSRRGGTQNVASIVGFGKAAELALHHLPDTTTAQFRDDFENHMLRTVPHTTVNGDRLLRLPNTSNLSFEGVESDAALLLLDEAGIFCSAGSACTSGSVHASHVLKAMGVSNQRARASLRFSFGRFNSPTDVSTACTTLPKIVKKLRDLSPLGSLVLAK